MRALFSLLAVTLLPAISLAQIPPPPPPPPINPILSGPWTGTIDIGIPLHVIFTFTRTPGGGLTATLSSPDQGPGATPVGPITLAGTSITIDVPKIGSHFTGTLDDATQKITGKWTQSGHDFPLTLTPAKDVTALTPKRPQEPHAPFPYRAEDITFPNTGANIQLGGTLTLPSGTGPFPAAILISGSGPHDRDETVLGHKPFLLLADFLTRHGIAVLRYDKRGLFHSTGNYATATGADFATDAEAALAYLRTRPEIDSHRIGLIGHSEGGMIAPVVAAKDPAHIDFVILMAGPGVTGEDVLVEQVRLLALASGKSSEAAQTAANHQRAVVQAVLSSPNNAALRETLRSAAFATIVPPAQVDVAAETLGSPWYRYFLAYNPAPTLARVRCPVLALDGTKDMQVSAAQNLPAIKAAVLAGGNTHVETINFPNLNHLFQTATTGTPTEYATLEETIAPVVLNTIANWITSQPALPTSASKP